MDEDEVRRAMAAVAEEAKKEPHRFGPEAMAVVVRALRAGATIAAAAEAAGFTRCIVNRWREKSPAFDAACSDAIAAGDVPRLVAVRNGEGPDGEAEWTIRRGRRHRFDDERKLIFLEHFAATLDAVASAEEAGVSFSTAYAHRRSDPGFAAAWLEAAEIGIARIGEETGRQRLAAIERFRVRGDKQVPPGDGDREFERTMTFLRVWKTKLSGGRTGGPPLTKWSFDKALDQLERQLRNFGVRIEREEAEVDGTGRDGSGRDGEDESKAA